MRPSEKIEKLVRQFDIDVNGERDRQILDKLQQAHAEAGESKVGDSPISLWRTLMRSYTTKIAAAAVIILIAVFGISSLNQFTAPAWAIDETVDVLRKFNGIYCSGTTLDGQGEEVPFELWAKANAEQTASDNFRLEAGNGHVTVVSEATSYRYDPDANTVSITEGYGAALQPWPGARFLESMKKTVLDWKETYGKDAATDRDRVYVTCSHPAAPGPRSWWFEFDVESKLLIGFKQWENMSRQGLPEFNAKSITYYEDLPDELFHFETPEGAKTVNGLDERMKKLQDPNAGMPMADMTEEQACTEIVRRHWQAVIEQDWQTVALLRPVATAEHWESKYAGSNLTKIIELSEPYQEDGCTIVPCTIGFSNDVTRKINTAVLLREINGRHSCVIANTWARE